MSSTKRYLSRASLVVAGLLSSFDEAQLTYALKNSTTLSTAGL
jgi:hypothetical protein